MSAQDHTGIGSPRAHSCEPQDQRLQAPYTGTEWVCSSKKFQKSWLTLSQCSAGFNMRSLLSQLTLQSSAGQESRTAFKKVWLNAGDLKASKYYILQGLGEILLGHHLSSDVSNADRWQLKCVKCWQMKMYGFFFFPFKSKPWFQKTGKNLKNETLPSTVQVPYLLMCKPNMETHSHVWPLSISMWHVQQKVIICLSKFKSYVGYHVRKCRFFKFLSCLYF